MTDDGYSLECDENVKTEYRKARRKALYWVIAGLVIDGAIRLSHWLLDFPHNIEPLDEAVCGFCMIVAVYWYYIYPTIFFATSVMLEFRLRSIEMRERLEAIETQLALER